MKKFFMFILLGLGIASLIMEHWVTSIIDILLVIFLIADFIMAFKESPVKKHFIKKNIPLTAFVMVYVTLFVLNRLYSFQGYTSLIIIRNTLLILKVFGRVRKFSLFLNSIFSKPAQTVVISFILVILLGTIALMLPVMTIDTRINFINALFTVTSAVCVTGLAVVDTATYFSVYGKIVILVLIQIGGLGIMLLSYFIVFSFKRSVSVKDRNILSFMLNTSDLKGIIANVKHIIILTFSIEAAGALLLFPLFKGVTDTWYKALFYGIFHSVSAFCNAGFALFSNSLESFSGSFGINMVVSGLIIAGGISFPVLTELAKAFSGIFKGEKIRFSLNTRVVVNVSLFLIFSGMLIIYKLEHINMLWHRPIYEQYLSAFFQSVTLRTAGFNTLPIGNMKAGTLMLMISIMFIGGASGSTAGGIKVNTLGVVWSYIQSFRRGSENSLIYKHIVSRDSILQAFTVIVFGIVSISVVSVILMITEDAEPVALLFESVSAFATVGLSAGVTPSLTLIGRILIILLMFIGRLGPLTLLTASSVNLKSSRVTYPEAKILVG